MAPSRIQCMNLVVLLFSLNYYAADRKSFVIKMIGNNKRAVAELIAAQDGLDMQFEICKVDRSPGGYLINFTQTMEEQNPTNKLIRHQGVAWAMPREQLKSKLVTKLLEEHHPHQAAFNPSPNLLSPKSSAEPKAVTKYYEDAENPAFKSPNPFIDSKSSFAVPMAVRKPQDPMNFKLDNIKPLNPDTGFILADRRTNIKLDVEPVNTFAALKREDTQNVKLNSKPLVYLDPEAVFCYRSSRSRNEMRYCKPLVNDPNFQKQWFMLPWPSTYGQTAPYDLNILPVWIKYNNFGQGVKVIVFDDGIQTDHQDLVYNYDPKYGYDAVYDHNDPNPENLGDSHGTKCSGVIAMTANNHICGVGIAPLVTLGMVKIRASNYNFWVVIVKALLFKHKEIDVTTNSYYFSSPFEKPPRSVFSALKTSMDEGRNGKGVIHIHAAGNDKEEGHMCGASGLVNSIYTIVVATCRVDGEVTYYAERCAAIMVTVFSTDWRGNPAFYLPSTDTGNHCSNTFGYTSGGIARASGIMALLLQANPEITWRDTQHLLAWTSQYLHVSESGVWQKNKAGFYVSEDFGFGLLDAYNLVTMASTFKHVPPMSTCAMNIVGKNNSKAIRFGYKLPVKKIVHITICHGVPNEVKFIEHVQLQISLTYPKRGDVQIKIISPGETEALLLARQPNDSDSQYGIDNWTFDSVLTWGESPIGKWTIQVYAKTGAEENEGRISEMSLIIHGTVDKPLHYGPHGSFRTTASYEIKTYEEMLN